MSSSSSFVQSPAGIWLASGLLVPYLTPEGKAEVSAFWDTDVETLFAQVTNGVQNLAHHPTLHAALGVWLRDHELPERAALELGGLVAHLSTDTAQAKHVLDTWAAAHTQGMIKAFPVAVTEETKAVLASALAVDDTWARPAEESHVGFAGAWVKGFEAPATPTQVRVLPGGSAVQVTLPLASGLMDMTFCVSLDGPSEALRLLDHPARFTDPVEAGAEPLVGERMSLRSTQDVAVRVPEFSTEHTVDLLEDATRWGLVEAFRPNGVPGLGGRVPLEVTEAKQSAFIEVSYTGVRAAAVTALSMRAGCAMPTQAYTQREVNFDRPFAYRVTSLGWPVLFEGVYVG